jgi:hypothetical protein
LKGIICDNLCGIGDGLRTVHCTPRGKSRAVTRQLRFASVWPLLCLSQFRVVRIYSFTMSTRRKSKQAAAAAEPDNEPVSCAPRARRARAGSNSGCQSQTQTTSTSNISQGSSATFPSKSLLRMRSCRSTGSLSRKR